MHVSFWTVGDVNRAYSYLLCRSIKRSYEVMNAKEEQSQGGWNFMKDSCQETCSSLFWISEVALSMHIRKAFMFALDQTTSISTLPEQVLTESINIKWCKSHCGEGERNAFFPYLINSDSKVCKHSSAERRRSADKEAKFIGGVWWTSCLRFPSGCTCWLKVYILRTRWSSLLYCVLTRWRAIRLQKVRVNLPLACTAEPQTPFTNTNITS